jgi:ABC-2 type transport system permease protein
MMIAVLAVEFRKLNRSLALLLAVVAPALIAVFTFFNMLRGSSPDPYDMWLISGEAIWAFFMLPMSVTALTALVANMEHGPKSWDHLRALPLPRWRLYAAKTLSVIAVVALMSALTLAMTWAAVEAASLVKPAVRPTDSPDLAKHAWILVKMLAAALLLIALQLWMALRFASFVPGLALGIGGTFFAVVATTARAGVFMPWQMPVNMLTTEVGRPETALLLGGAGGLIALALAVAHLAWREVR